MQHLKKILGRWDSIAVIMAIVLGGGIFRVPAEVAKYLNSTNLILLAWLAGGIIALLGALCYAELSSSFPETGGNYVYLRKSYGPMAGFLFGWAELIAIRTGSIAAVSFIAAEYLRSFLLADKSLIKPIAVFIVLTLSLINIVGLRYGKRVQSIFTITNVSTIIGILIFGIISKKGDVSHFASAPVVIDRGIFHLFGLALIPILWTYGGWHENTFVAGETKDAGKTLPLALITAIFIITALYLAINALYIYLIPVREIAGANLIAASALEILYGKNGRKILEGLVIVASIGSINAMIITGSRITYAMAKDNAVFQHISKVNDKYGTPHRAIIITATWSMALIILGTFSKLLFFTGILVWLFFALAAAGLFILRYRFPDIERPYRVWGYPLVPAIFILICIALFINTLIFYPRQSLIGLGLLAGGIPVYLMSRRKKLLTLLIVLTLCAVAFAESDGLTYEREKMVEKQIKNRGITDPKVLDAMKKVKRHLFVPEDIREAAYQDSPLPIGQGQTISQPYIVAYMTEAARLKADDRVLEIGTGSGYQAAILAEMVKEVYTIEILKPLADLSRARLEEMGYGNIKVKWGDGYEGWVEYSPFDAIIVTAAPSEVPEKLIGQLKTGGRMVVPIGSFFQELYLITRTASGFEKKKLLPVRFVPMVHPE